MQGPWGLPEGVLEGSRADLQVLDPRGVGLECRDPMPLYFLNVSRMVTLVCEKGGFFVLRVLYVCQVDQMLSESTLL